MPKPAFDPSKPFESVKPAFDPNIPFETGDQSQPTSGAQSTQAAIEGFGQGVAMGYLPQLQAIGGLLTPNPTKDVDEKLKAQGFTIDQPKDTYVSLRDENIARQEKFAKDNPYAYYGGQFAGTVASAPVVSKALSAVPGMGLLGKAGAPTVDATGQVIDKGSRIARTAQAALGGAAMGAIQNPGDTQGVVDVTQWDKRKANAWVGAVVGGATQLGTEAIKGTADLILSIPKRMKEYAELKAFKSTGAMLKDFRKASDRGNINAIGREMMDKGMVKPGSTFEDVAEKSVELRNKAGGIIGDLYDTAQKKINEIVPTLPYEKHQILAKTELNAANVADDLLNKFTGELKGRAGSKSALNQITTTLEELKQNGNNTNLQVFQSFKEGLDDIIKYDKSLNDMPLAKQYLAKIRDELKSRIQARIGALDQVLGSESLQTLKDANKQYGIWSEVSRIAKDRVSRENANRFASLTDTIAGVGGAGAGAAAGAAIRGDLESTLKGAAMGSALGLLNKGARLYGNPIATTALDKSASILGAIPSPVTGTVSRTAGLLAQNPAALGAGAANIFGRVNNSMSTIPPQDQTIPQRPILGERDKPTRKPAKGEKR